MNIKRFHEFIKNMKNNTCFLKNEQQELNEIFSEENFIQECTIRKPYIIIKTKVPKNFLIDFLLINEEMINTNFSCLDYSTYLLDCREFKENTKKEESVDKCDIIDIAEEEMKGKDFSELNAEFETIMVEEYTKKFLDAIQEGTVTKEFITEYKKILNDKDILDLRISGDKLYIKTLKSIIPLTLSSLMGLEEKCFEEVPISGKYYFYVVDASKWGTPKQQAALYDKEELFDLIKEMGKEKIPSLMDYTQKIRTLIEKAFKEYYDAELYEAVKYSIISIEEPVLAIAFEEFIPDLKEKFSEALGLPEEVFIEVSTPLFSSILIDGRRWYLEDLVEDL